MDYLSCTKSYLRLVELHLVSTSGEHHASIGVLFQLDTMRPTGYCRWSYRYWPKNQHTAEKYVQLPPLTDTGYEKRRGFNLNSRILNCQNFKNVFLVYSSVSGVLKDLISSLRQQFSIRKISSNLNIDLHKL